MKHQVTLALALALAMAASLLAGCTNASGGVQPAGAAQTSQAGAASETEEKSPAFTDEMKIPYAVDLSPEDGADSVERLGDHEDSPLFCPSGLLQHGVQRHSHHPDRV